MLAAANSNPLTLNATFIVEIVVFVVLLYLLRRYVYPPIDRALRNRQQQIADALSEAERARRELEEARLQEREERAEARRQAQEILENAQKQAEVLRDELVERGRQEQEALLERARSELAREREQASQELRRQLADLVMSATSRVLEEGLDANLQRRLVERAVQQVDISA